MLIESNNPKISVVSREAMAGLGLDAFPPYPDGWVLSGTPDHKVRNAFSGSIHAGIYEAMPSKLVLKDYPADELMFVLSGSVTVIEDGGGTSFFLPGDCFILQKGFNGTFEMFGIFRKLAVAAHSGDAVKVDWLESEE